MLKDIEVCDFTGHMGRATIVHDVGHHKFPVDLSDNKDRNTILSRAKIGIDNDLFRDGKIWLPSQFETAFASVADPIGGGLPVVLKLDPHLCGTFGICVQNNWIGDVDIGAQLALSGFFRASYELPSGPTTTQW